MLLRSVSTSGHIHGQGLAAVAAALLAAACGFRDGNGVGTPPLPSTTADIAPTRDRAGTTGRSFELAGRWSSREARLDVTATSALLTLPCAEVSFFPPQPAEDGTFQSSGTIRPSGGRQSSELPRPGSRLLNVKGTLSATSLTLVLVTESGELLYDPITLQRGTGEEVPQCG